jgi:plasmid maintenance system antidote protein VapI
MGSMLGIPQGNISQMEHGKRPIGKQIAKRIAEFFKTDYHLFL